MTKEELVTLAPPAAVSAISFCGWSLQDWMYIATIGYTVLLIGKFFWKLGVSLKKEINARRHNNSKK